MGKAVKFALGGAGSLLMILTLAGVSNRQDQRDRERRLYLLDDIVSGKTIGGKLHAAAQIVCFDAADLARAKFGGGNVPGARDQIMDQLVTDDRCIIAGEDVGFDMDIDGRQIYHTPHGTASLWAETY